MIEEQIKSLTSLIPDQFYDTHIHSPFPKVHMDTNISRWQSGSMFSGYFFETGLNLESLKLLYPFPKKELFGVAIPIPYGPFTALEVNENLLENEKKVKNLHLILRGDVSDQEIPKLEKQVKRSKKVKGFKLYQRYEIKSTKDFLEQALSPKLLKLANENSLVFFIHTNSTTPSCIDLLDQILRKYTKVQIVLTHGGTKIEGYNSFDFADRIEFEKTRLSQKRIEKYEKEIKSYERLARKITKTPRLYVNTAFLGSEISLYPIFKILAPAKRIVYGSDLPFAYASRLVAERKSYDDTVAIVRFLYEGKDIQNFKREMCYSNLLFFLERIKAVCDFIDPKTTKEVFEDILYNVPKELMGD